MKNILLIEDDKTLSMGIAIALKDGEVNIQTCANLLCGRESYSKNKWDLVILDINLPDGNGLEFLKEIKREKNTPVILLTANDMETDIVMGLEMGADDYITKPFSLAVLRARVNTQLRRSSIEQGKISIDPFIFDFDHMEYFKGAHRIDLSKTEQKLLKCLVENRGITLSREVLVDRIWTDGSEYVDENALSVTMKRLRDKLEDNPSKPAYIKTIYGIGYQWVEERR